MTVFSCIWRTLKSKVVLHYSLVNKMGSVGVERADFIAAYPCSLRSGRDVISKGEMRF